MMPVALSSPYCIWHYAASLPKSRTKNLVGSKTPTLSFHDYTSHIKNHLGNVVYSESTSLKFVMRWSRSG